MDKFKVMMIDDDPDSIERVRLYLDSQLYSFSAVVDPREAILRAIDIHPDIIVLDIEMPEIKGFDVCKRLQSNIVTCNIPIIIYSVHGDDDSYVQYMDLGVNAVLEKLEKGNLTRLGATIERFTKKVYGQNEKLKIFKTQGHELRIQGDVNRIWLNGNERFLRPKVRKILAYLASKPGILVSSEDLLNQIYGGEDSLNRTPDDIHRLMHDLRDSIEPNPHVPIFIENKKRIGYRLIEGKINS